MEFWSPMGDGASSSEAVGRSSFPKCSLIVGDRSTITALPTILSKITMSSYLLRLGMLIIFSLLKKEVFLKFGIKIRTFSLFPFYFLYLNHFISFGTEGKQNIL